MVSLRVDRQRPQVSDVASLDRHVGGQDVAVYDLAGLIDSTENELDHLVRSEMPVVALDPAGRNDLVEGALRLAVAAVVTMTINPYELLSVLEMAAVGRSPEGDVAARSNHRENVRREYGLTGRELDILDAIGTGASNAEVCAQLFLSINTIKSYVRSSYKEIGARSRSRAVLWAAEHWPVGRH